ncbi:MAG: rhodanese-like domain-containing protein [Tepidiformaceae bacterium]
MAITAREMVMAARADLDLVAPEAASKESQSGQAVFVDVRQTEEWQHGHIAGAIRAPRGLLEFLADPSSPRHSEALDPTRRVIMVCHTGTRAALAGHTLQQLGYTDVALLEGGITAWQAAGLPLVEHEFAGI